MEYPPATENNLMIGTDFHLPLAPFCVVAQVLKGAMPSAEWMEKTVFVDDERPANILQDIGLFIPHVPVPPLPPSLIQAATATLTSSSQVAWGAFTVLIEDKPAGLRMTAPSMMNCGAPVSTPTGLLIPTGLTSVLIGFDKGDLAQSLNAQSKAAILGALVEQLTGKYVKRVLGNRLKKLEEEVADLIKDIITNYATRFWTDPAREQAEELIGEAIEEGHGEEPICEGLPAAAASRAYDAIYTDACKDINERAKANSHLFEEGPIAVSKQEFVTGFQKQCKGPGMHGLYQDVLLEGSSAGTATAVCGCPKTKDCVA
jgi:hypothetical protein